jgi:hypothetical protein
VNTWIVPAKQKGLDSASWPVKIFRAILHTPLPKIQAENFKFEMTQVAANHNFRLLERYKFDLGSAIADQLYSPVSCGSEFRSWKLIQPLVSWHPRWREVRDILQHNTNFPLRDLPDQDRADDLAFHAQRRNHKSFMKEDAVARKLITDKVHQGFSLPLPVGYHVHLKGASIAPMGIVHQGSIN